MRTLSIGRRAFTAALGAAPFAVSGGTRNAVNIVRVPESGIQPQIALGEDGVLQLIYFQGDPRQGDLFYVMSRDEGASFSTPLRVNSQDGSAVAAGTIRGGQIALGRNGRVHAAWNGSNTAKPAGVVDPHSGKPGHPMLYARLNDSRTAFEPQRNLMTSTFELDGGGSLAADHNGGVYVAWHGRSHGASEGEGGRQVYVSRSKDDGATFDGEKAAWATAAGACGCCGMRIFASRAGTLYMLFRSATESIHRDVYLLSAKPGTVAFTGGVLHRWEINACPMSSMSFTEGPRGVLASWETAGQVYFSPVSASAPQPIPASEAPAKRKHSYLATNANGQTLMIWSEGSGWQKGGALAWRTFDSSGKPTTDTATVGPIPTWSNGGAFARRDGGFTIIY